MPASTFRSQIFKVMDKGDPVRITTRRGIGYYVSEKDVERFLGKPLVTFNPTPKKSTR